VNVQLVTFRFEQGDAPVDAKQFAKATAAAWTSQQSTRRVTVVSIEDAPVTVD
jgi:hypothetical protein